MAPRLTPNGLLSQSNMRTEYPRQQKSQRHQSQQPSVAPNLGMSPAARYNHNLKVLRRRDPSIVSIFDQFSHVCVYHHNGNKWEKQGFEGSMFLYERELYPPYGFYILNRMGMDDYIQRLYPEDLVGVHGNYLMLRSYPDFTANRLSRIVNSSDKFSDVYTLHSPEKVLDADKGRSQTVGLWMFATDLREPMIDVMMRLHSYIKKNVPYPEEYHYGPDRPPPPNPHLHTGSPDDPNSPEGSNTSQDEQDQPSPNGSISELDKLFARLVPPASVPPYPLASTSKVTVDGLFAAVGGRDVAQRAHSTSQATPEIPHTSASSSSTGLALLDSIFASATPPFSRSSTTSTTTTMKGTGPDHITIHSPVPSVTTLPQILNQDVISTLLGLPPSRTASATDSISSNSNNSHSYSSGGGRSREGDNEDEGEDEDLRMKNGRGRVGGGGVSDAFSESSTVLDPEAAFDEELQAAGASAGRPLLSESNLVEGRVAVNGRGRIHGDVTPRGPAPVNGHDTPPRRQPQPPRSKSQSISGTTAQSTPELSLSSSTSTIRGSLFHATSDLSQLPNTNGTGVQARPLVPFEPDSELWPYPRVSVHERPSDAHDANHDVEDGDIVELDFADTSALSDPDAFDRVLLQRSNKSNTAPRTAVNGRLGSETGREGQENGQGKGTKRKSRRERQRQQREEIERGWDVPAPQDLGAQSSPASFSGPASPSPQPSPQPSPVLATAKTGPTTRPLVTELEIDTPTTARPLSRVPELNGTAKGKKGVLDAQTVRQSLIATFTQAQKPRVVGMERNEFVREVLMLIHTDKTFVDTLWQDYIARLE